MGLHQAGFEVVGVDIAPQPNYPFRFIRADALKALASARFLSNFVFVWASPPCQAYSGLRALWPDSEHPDLIEPVRHLLGASGLPWVIENVPGAPLHKPMRLCGSTFGLRVRRHRLFESNLSLRDVPCHHEWQDAHRPYITHQSSSRNGQRRTGCVPVYGHSQVKGQGAAAPNHRFYASVAMGIDWMTRAELAEAIPPAYARFIGRQVLTHLRGSW